MVFIVVRINFISLLFMYFDRMFVFNKGGIKLLNRLKFFNQALWFYDELVSEKIFTCKYLKTFYLRQSIVTQDIALI